MNLEYVIAVMLGLAGTALPASGQGASAALPVAQEKPADSREYAWAGQAPDFKDSVKAIAEVEVALQVDGDFGKAQRAIDGIWLRATALVGYPEQAELLVLTAMARAEMYAKQNKLGLALSAAVPVMFYDPLLVVPGSLRAELEPVTDRLQGILLEVKKDKRLMRLRGELWNEKRGGGSRTLRKIVREYFNDGKYKAISEIGVPAQTAFAEAILNETHEFPESIQGDPLLWLLEIGEPWAAQFMLDNLDAGGEIWKSRIIRTMKARNVLGNVGTWSKGEPPHVCLEPEWLELIEALLASPETATQALPFLLEPFQRDQLPPGIQQALVRGINSYGAKFANALMQLIVSDRGVARSALPVYEAAARLKQPLLARLAANALRHFEANETLLSMADSPDPETRRSVVSMLQPHVGRFLRKDLTTDTQGGEYWMPHTTKVSYTPKIDDKGRTLLTRFATDVSPAVRGSAAYALGFLDPPLERGVYLALAADENPSVRRSLAYAMEDVSLDDETLSKVLALLIESGDVAVLEMVDSILVDGRLASKPTVYMDPLRLRFSSLSGGSRRRVVEDLLKTAKGSAAVVRWLLSESDSVELRDIYFGTSNSVRSGHGTQFMALGDKQLGQLFALGMERGTPLISDQLAWLLLDTSPARTGGLQYVMNETKYSLTTRLKAAEAAAPGRSVGFEASLLAVLGDERWGTRPADQGELEAITEAVDAMDEDAGSALKLLVAKDRSIQDAVASRVVGDFDASTPYAKEITRAVLDRWLSPGATFAGPVRSAIECLASMPEEATVEILSAAALRPECTSSAVNTMGVVRKKEYLPILTRCLKAEWLPLGPTSNVTRGRAARAIAAYQTEEIVPILLAGLGSSSSSVRDACSSGLILFRQTQQTRQSWESFRTPKKAPATKQSALQDLVEMLDDDNLDVRLQAIRGMGTLGAIEHLPTMIRLLKDPTPKVVAAAKEAIEILTLAARKPFAGQ